MLTSDRPYTFPLDSNDLLSNLRSLRSKKWFMDLDSSEQILALAINDLITDENSVPVDMIRKIVPIRTPQLKNKFNHLCLIDSRTDIARKISLIMSEAKLPLNKAARTFLYVSNKNEVAIQNACRAYLFAKDHSATKNVDLNCFMCSPLTTFAWITASQVSGKSLGHLRKFKQQFNPKEKLTLGYLDRLDLISRAYRALPEDKKFGVPEQALLTIEEGGSFRKALEYSPTLGVILKFPLSLRGLSAKYDSQTKSLFDKLYFSYTQLVKDPKNAGKDFIEALSCALIEMAPPGMEDGIMEEVGDKLKGFDNIISVVSQLSDKQFRAWLDKLVGNTLINLDRLNNSFWRRWEKDNLIDIKYSHIPGPDMMSLIDTQVTFDNALGTMCEEFSDLFQGMVLEKLSTEEFSISRKVPIGTAKSRLHRARVYLLSSAYFGVSQE